MRSLQGRLLAAVALLAMAAVAGVALAARRGARSEITTFLELERGAARDDFVRQLRSLAASHRDGLSTGDLSAAAEQFPADGAAILLAADGRLLAVAGQPLQGASVAAARRGDELALTLSRERDGRSDRRQLRLRGGGVPVMAMPPDPGRDGDRTRDGDRDRGDRNRGGDRNRDRDGASGSLTGAPIPAALFPLMIPTPRAASQPAAMLGSLDHRLTLIAAAAAALALAATWLLTRRILAPVRQLQDAAQDLAAGRLDRRVAAGGPVEIADLGRAFNAMAGELERQQRLRRDLVNDVAHELRAPLTAMLCRLDAAQDGVGPEPAAALAGLQGDVAHLTRLVEDLQELALAEAGRLALHIAPQPLGGAVRSALRGAGLEHDSRLRIHIAADLAPLADPVRLRQVLVNLLTNAARHTPESGIIAVRAGAAVAVAMAPPEVSIEIADTGCGLTEEQLGRVFERFYRADASRQRATGGTGLGLAIVKALVEAQGGRVWASSEPGRGATFGLALPAAGGATCGGPATSYLAAASSGRPADIEGGAKS